MNGIIAPVAGASFLRRALGLIVAMALCCLLGAGALAQGLLPVPKLSARVTDTTGTLDAAQRGALEAQLAAIEQRKGSQVALLVVPTTQPETIESYTVRVFEVWKIGRGFVDGRRVDDGVLIVVAKDDRRVRIEVGYGLEGAIPDAIAKRIIDEQIVPRFRAGDFAGGLGAAIEVLGRLIDGETLPAPQAAAGEAEDDDASFFGGLVTVFVLGSIATAWLGKRLGPVVAGVVATTMTLVSGGSLPAAIIAGIVAYLVFLVFANAPANSMQSRGRGIHTSGGWGDGGGWSGGGSSGGGFGGGGGSSGGGGASGSW